MQAFIPPTARTTPPPPAAAAAAKAGVCSRRLEHIAATTTATEHAAAIWQAEQAALRAAAAARPPPAKKAPQLTGPAAILAARMARICPPPAPAPTPEPVLSSAVKPMYGAPMYVSLTAAQATKPVKTATEIAAERRVALEAYQQRMQKHGWTYSASVKPVVAAVEPTLAKPVKVEPEKYSLANAVVLPLRQMLRPRTEKKEAALVKPVASWKVPLPVKNWVPEKPPPIHKAPRGWMPTAVSKVSVKPAQTVVPKPVVKPVMRTVQVNRSVAVPAPVLPKVAPAIEQEGVQRPNLIEAIVTMWTKWTEQRKEAEEKKKMEVEQQNQDVGAVEKGVAIGAAAQAITVILSMGKAQ